MTRLLPRVAETSVGRVALVGSVCFAYVALLVAAAADAPVAFAAFLLIAVAADQWLETKEPNLQGLLRGAQFGIPTRAVVQVFALALLIARHFPSWSDGTLIAVLLLTVSIAAVRWAYLTVLFVYGHRSARPVQTRNVDLGRIADPPPPPTLLTKSLGSWLVNLSLIPLGVGALDVSFDGIRVFIVIALVYDALVIAALAALLLHLVRLLRRPSHTAFTERALGHLRGLEPEVVLYFSGSADSAYQINMWLQPLAQLPQRCLIVLRERHVLDSLAPTDLPVVLIPSGVTVMETQLASVRVALYAANTSKNIHLLREPGMKHVFIGHGDSDKVSSINPFTKVYDEVWVAGRAGRERYARAGVGIRDETIVEVGRPQLDVLAHAHAVSRTGPLTVLYAPTWEGWNDEAFDSSIIGMGATLVAKLLATPDVRVIYKPHPFTGRRDRRAQRAHVRIERMLAKAQAAATDAPGADSQLLTIERALGRPGLSPAQAQRLSAEWSARFWTGLPDTQHVVVTGALPTLYDCFNHADLMIADVSSVVSDFLATGKPYVCTNSRGIEQGEFRTQNPTATAAYLLGPDCAELPQLLADVRAEDSLRVSRQALREYLLGPDKPPSIVRWELAVDSLAKRAATLRQGPAGPDDDAPPLERDGHELPSERVD